MAPGKRFSQPLPQRRVSGLTRDIPERLDDVHWRIPAPRTPGDSAGEVDHAREVAVVGDEDDLELGGLKVTGPAGGDDRVDLEGGGDSEDGDVAGGGELGSGVCAALDFGIDFGAGFE